MFRIYIFISVVALTETGFKVCLAYSFTTIECFLSFSCAQTDHTTIALCLKQARASAYWDDVAVAEKTELVM